MLLFEFSFFVLDGKQLFIDKGEKKSTGRLSQILLSYSIMPQLLTEPDPTLGAEQEESSSRLVPCPQRIYPLVKVEVGLGGAGVVTL